MKVIFLLLIFLNILFAHKVNLFITNDGEKVDIYSYFANGKPCVSCKFIVKDNSNIVIEDSLDDKGKYSFQAKSKKLEITVDAGSGHIAKKELELKDIDTNSIDKQIEEEKSDEFFKIILSLILIFIIFYILKRFKKR